MCRGLSGPVVAVACFSGMVVFRIELQFLLNDNCQVQELVLSE